MISIRENFYNEIIKIQLLDTDLIGSISLTFLANIEKTNPEIYDLIPDNCPFNFSNTMYGYDLHVLEKYRNKGYGKKIIKECEEYLKKNEIKFFFLYRNNDKILNNFYESLGFKDLLMENDFILFYKHIY